MADETLVEAAELLNVGISNEILDKAVLKRILYLINLGEIDSDTITTILERCQHALNRTSYFRASYIFPAGVDEEGNHYEAFPETTIFQKRGGTMRGLRQFLENSGCTEIEIERVSERRSKGFLHPAGEGWFT
jgi:hypothetical protein